METFLNGRKLDMA